MPDTTGPSSLLNKQTKSMHEIDVDVVFDTFEPIEFGKSVENAQSTYKLTPLRQHGEKFKPNAKRPLTNFTYEYFEVNERGLNHQKAKHRKVYLLKKLREFAKTDEFLLRRTRREQIQIVTQVFATDYKLLTKKQIGQLFGNINQASVYDALKKK
ncbi:hypothetical protein QTN25_005059 [Entamoeba marina]